MSAPISPSTPNRARNPIVVSPSPAVPQKKRDLCIIWSLKAKLESFAAATLVQLENSKSHVCYACDECLPYKIYDTQLFSEEQARGCLTIPSADIEAANNARTELENQLSALSRRNTNQQNEILAYRDLVSRFEKVSADSTKKDNLISQLKQEISFLKRIAGVKNERFQFYYLYV